MAFSLKRTLEDTYGRVRVRGELSRVSVPKSGHLYTGIKDEKSVLDAVCWKGVLSKLSVRPEEGLEVICTGKITTYPMSSKYQLVIETMELAGEGALLKMLEERKKKLAAEGLFAAERKKPLPFLPEKIGVVTSPTGAVIRDILHRLNDRFPRHVMVWPVKVQGEKSDEEISRAIDGFNALPETHRPDIIIVARGGGSLEDLMAFNEENVVRATANSEIPIISAVGHETDTTLIDYASDLRAPTPTGAAELAVPVRVNLMAQVREDKQRLISAMNRLTTENKRRTENIAARLGQPERLLEIKTQQSDHAGEKLENIFRTTLQNKKEKLINVQARLLHPKQLLDRKATNLEKIYVTLQGNFKHSLINKKNKSIQISSRLQQPKTQIENAKIKTKHLDEKLQTLTSRHVENKERRLQNTHEKLELLSFQNVLNRGFVVVRDEQGTPVTSPKNLRGGKNVQLQFKDNEKVDAVINTSKIPQKKSAPAKPQKTEEKQESLF